MDPQEPLRPPPRAAAPAPRAVSVPRGRFAPALHLGAILLVPLILSLFFTLALVLACLIPRAFIEQNVRRSADAMLSRGVYPRAFNINSKAFQLDYYTDAIMLNIAYEVDARHPFHAALADSQVVSVHDQQAIGSLGWLATPKDFHAQAYPRYWHGYLIYLRPLLVWFDYERILLVLAVVLTAMSLALLRVLYKKGIAIALPFALALLLTNVMVVVQSLQLVQTYIIATGFSLWATHSDRRPLTTCVVGFLVAGGVTAFFDLLSAPLMTWGVPLLIVLYWLHQEGRLQRMREGLKVIAASGAAWGFSYGACWGCKWIVSSMMLKTNVLADAFEQIAFRAGDTQKGSQVMNALSGVSVPVRISAPLVNIAVLVEWDNSARMILNCVMYAVLVITAIVIGKKFRKRPLDRWFVGLLLMIAAVPYVWYVLAAEHSERHHWFTYRNQMITIMAMACAWCQTVDWESMKGAVGRAFARGLRP